MFKIALSPYYSFWGIDSDMLSKILGDLLKEILNKFSSKLLWCLSNSVYFFLHYGMSIPQRWGWIKKNLRNPKSAVNSILLEFTIVGIVICLRYYCGSRTLEHSFILLKRAESYPRGKYIMLWLKATRCISSKSLYNNHLNIHRTLLSILRILRISKGP
jgi:hypothetical protein